MDWTFWSYVADAMTIPTWEMQSMNKMTNMFSVSMEALIFVTHIDRSNAAVVAICQDIVDKSSS